MANVFILITGNFLGDKILGSDFRVKKSHNTTVSHPAKQKGAKVAFDFTKPIHKSGRNDEGGHWSYIFNPDEGTLGVCSDTGNYCITAKDTDKNGKFDTGTIYRFDEGKESEEKLDENNSENDVETLARNSLTALLQQDKEYHPPKVDIKGKIGKFRQQTTGDCGLLGSTLALAFTSEGKKIIKDSIKKDNNGDVLVELKGINEIYEVSPEEIHDAKWRLSNGSDDMRAVELAIEKQVVDSANNSLRLSKMYPGGFDEESIQKQLKEKINGIPRSFVFKLLTKGHVEEVYSHNWQLKEDPDDPFQPSTWVHVNPSEDTSIAEKAEAENEKTKKMLDDKMRNPNRFAMSISIVVSKYGPDAHAVAIKRVDKKNVVYVNPWDSSKEIKVPRDEFMQNYNGIASCDLRTRRSKEEDAFAR